MNFAWSDYLHLARQLLQESETAASREAKQRAAISRAYYAAFCTARNHLRDNESVSIPKGAAHKVVRLRFEESPDRVRKEIAVGLNELRIQRNRADYDDAFAELRATADAALTLAEEVIALLASLK